MSSMIDSCMTEALGQFLDVNVARYKIITLNMANIDTPGYKTRDLDFGAELHRAAIAADNEEDDRGPAVISPVARPVRGLMERPDGNNVSLERETLLVAEIQMKFNLGVQLVKDQFHTISLAINSGEGSSS
jgi:flagellar basal-body rod protein FlgB